MRKVVTSAQVCLRGRGNFTYVLALLHYTVREDDSFSYELVPNYEVIDLLEPTDFQGIPGFNLSQKKKSYCRENKIPTLIADRAPMQNREDLWQLLEECGMEYWNPVEWLIRSPRRYIGDKLFFREVPMEELRALDIGEAIERAANSLQAVNTVLSALCEGRELKMGEEALEFPAKKVLYGSLMLLHEKMRRGQDAAVASGHAKSGLGRKRQPIDELMLREAIARYKAHQWTAQEAAESLGVSVPTFYRRMAEFTQPVVKTQEYS